MYKDEKPPASPRSALAEKHGIDAFALFCAYHLGITASDGYEFQNVHQVARRFGVSSGIIKQILQDLAMDPDRLVNSDFDLSSAQIDVLEVPDGVSRTEVAREHWDAFRRAKLKPRDWQRELAADARANESTFGPRAPQRPGRR